MPSIGHVIVGVAAGRAAGVPRAPSQRFTVALLVGVSLAPDLDVIGLLLGAPNGSVWGHRGATHSLAAVLVLIVLAYGMARRWRLPAGRMAVAAGLVAMSHLVLDSMNVGSRGVPWLWPLSSTLTGLAWQPIPAVVEVRDFLTLAGVRVVLAELLVFAPALVYALWPRSRKVVVGGWNRPVEET